jgi:hypothetical protein
MPFVPADALRVLLASLLILSPGLLLIGPLFGARRPRGAVGLALGATLGLGSFGLFLRLAGVLRASLGLCIFLWAALAAAGAAAGLRHWRAARRRRAIEAAARDRGPGTTPGFPWPDFSGAPGRWVAFFCLLGAVLAALQGMSLSGTSDTWDYLNRAAVILRADGLDAGNSYAAGLHDPYDPTFYGFIAALGRISGVPLPQLWNFFPAVATPLEIGVVALVAGTVVGSGAAGAAAAGIYTLLYGRFFLFRTSVHHQMLGDALFLVALAMLFVYRRQGRFRHLALGAAAAAAGAVFHHFIVVQSAFTFGLAGVALFLSDRRTPGAWRRPVAFTAAVAAALAPAVLALLTTRLEGVDVKQADAFFRETYAPLRHFGPLYIPDPVSWYGRISWHPLPALLLLAYLGRRLWRDPRALVPGVLLVAPVLIVFNPLVFPLVAGAAGLQVATRLINLTTYPSVILFGWVLTELIRGRRIEAEPPPAGRRPDTGEAFGAGAMAPPPPVSRRRAFVCAGLSILCILPQAALSLPTTLSGSTARHHLAGSPISWRTALERLRREARPGQVVLSDLVTSYSVPTFAPLFVVATQRPDFAFQTPDHAQRLDAVQEVLDPLAPADSTLAALRAWQVDWILVNRRFADPLTLDKLEMLEGRGVPWRFEEAGLVAFSVDPRGSTAALPPAAALEARLLIPPAVFARMLDPGAGITFDRESGVGAVIGPDRASPGDTLFITLYYEWRETAPSPNLIPKLLRESAYGSASRKVWRQIRGRLFRQEDAALFPRDLNYRAFRDRRLPPGSVYADQFLVKIPREAVPGLYGLYVRPGAFPTEGNLGLKLGSVSIAPASQRNP